MAMKEYEIEIAGVKHTVQLEEADVKRYPGAKAVSAKTKASGSGSSSSASSGSGSGS